MPLTGLCTLARALLDASGLRRSVGERFAPRRPALLEESGETLLRFGRRADVGDAARGLGDELRVDCSALGERDQLFGRGERTRPVRVELAQDRADLAADFLVFGDVVDEADAKRFGAVELLSGEHVAMGHAAADRG